MQKKPHWYQNCGNNETQKNIKSPFPEQFFKEKKVIDPCQDQNLCLQRG